MSVSTMESNSFTPTICQLLAKMYFGIGGMSPYKVDVAHKTASIKSEKNFAIRKKVNMQRFQNLKNVVNFRGRVITNPNPNVPNIFLQRRVTVFE